MQSSIKVGTHRFNQPLKNFHSQKYIIILVVLSILLQSQPLVEVGSKLGFQH